MSADRAGDAPHAERLRLRRDFEQVFTKGARSRGPLMTLYGTVNGLHRSRLGISIGKKVGIAVERNRIKRRLRAAGRVLVPGDPPIDLVIRPVRGCLTASFEELGKCLSVQVTEIRARLVPGGRR